MARRPPKMVGKQSRFQLLLRPSVIHSEVKILKLIVLIRFIFTRLVIELYYQLINIHVSKYLKAKFKFCVHI